MRNAAHLVMTLLGALIFAAPVFADAPTSEVDQLLDLLVTKNIITSTEAADFRSRLKKTEPGSTAGTVVSSMVTPASTATDVKPTKVEGGSTKNKLMNISGYVQARFTGAPRTTNTFEIRRARLFFDGQLSDKIGYQVQFDAAKPQLLDARLDYKPWRQFGTTLGQFKVPFSTESMMSDNLLPFIERTPVVNLYAPDRDNGSQGRDIGLQFSGKALRTSGVARIEYFVGVFNGDGINTRDDNHYKDTAVRVLVRPLKQLALIGNYYNGAAGVKEISHVRYDAELSYVRGPITLEGEYLWGYDGPIRRNGWFVYSTYRFTKNWDAGFRFDKFSPGQITPTLVAQNNYVLGTTYYLNPYVTLKANYDLQQDLSAKRNNNIVLLQTQFQFSGERGQQ